MRSKILSVNQRGFTPTPDAKNQESIADYLYIVDQQQIEGAFDSVISKFEDKSNLSREDVSLLRDASVKYVQAKEQLVSGGSRLLMPLFNQSLSEGDVPLFLAVVVSNLKNSIGIEPNNTQILSAMLLIQKDMGPKHGCLSEMSTGEGKTIVIMLLAAYQVLMKQNSVHVVTSNAYLAKRDEAFYEKALSSFSVKTHAINIKKDSDTPANLDVEILFGTNHSFELLQLNLELRGLPAFKKDVAIVDEVDSLLIDGALIPSRVGYPNSSYATSLKRTLNVMIQFFSKQEEGISYDQALSFLERDNKKSFSSPKSREIFKAVYDAHFNLEEGVDYVVVDDTIQLIDQGAGRYYHGLRASNYIHESLEAKHSLPVRPAQNPLAKYDHINYFNEYDRLFGLTGTLGGAEEIEEINSYYDVDILMIPPHKPSKQTELSIKIEADQSYRQTLLSSIREKLENNRSVLVFVENIKQSELLFEWISRSLSMSDGTVQLYHGLKEDSESQIVDTAGLPRVVTIATSIAGRGVDIRPSSLVLDGGGMHVVVTYLPRNKRVINQMAGRSARQGEHGSFEIMLPRSLATKYSNETNVYAPFFVPNPTEFVSKVQRAWTHHDVVIRKETVKKEQRYSQLQRHFIDAQKKLLVCIRESMKDCEQSFLKPDKKIIKSVKKHVSAIERFKKKIFVQKILKRNERIESIDTTEMKRFLYQVRASSLKSWVDLQEGESFAKYLEGELALDKIIDTDPTVFYPIEFMSIILELSEIDAKAA
jgi:preprotein translocase subunit SecA